MGLRQEGRRGRSPKRPSWRGTQHGASALSLVFNFPRKFVDNETGYLLGKPVNFISKSDHRQAVACIDRNTAHWEKEHNISLRKASEIFGKAYKINYAVAVPSRPNHAS